MKKSLFFGAMASMMLFATSCQEELPVVEPGGEAVVSFNLSTPQLATRAYSKGEQIDNLKYAVYDHNKEIIADLSETDEGIEFGGSKTLKMQLTNGSTYTIIFWASHTASYNETTYPYTIDWGKKQLTVNYNGASNDDKRDAFFEDVTFKVEGSKPVDVTLTRPFAQLNIGTNDLDESATAQYTVTHTAVKANAKVPSEFSLLGDSDGNHAVSEEVEVEFTFGEIPSQNETFPVEGYNYLAMNYVLANDVQETLIPIVTLQYKNGEGSTDVREREFGQVPVRRNYRTNIYGSLLTNGVDVNVDINPDFVEPGNNIDEAAVSNGNNNYRYLHKAVNEAQDGDVIVLNTDINYDLSDNALRSDATWEGFLSEIKGKKVTIDLNGKNMTVNIPDVAANGGLFRVLKGGVLTIQGEGNIDITTAKAENRAVMLVSNEGGTVNLKGGNWTLKCMEYPDALMPCFVDNNTTLGASTLNIYGGTYTFHRNMFRNFCNNKTEIASIYVYGGTFVGKNVETEEVDKAFIWNQKANGTTAMGKVYILGGTFDNVEVSDDWDGAGEISGDEVKVVENVEQFATALAEGGDIVLKGDVTATETMTVAAGKTATIFMNGGNLQYAVSNDGKAAAIINNAGNLTLAGEGTISFVAANPDLGAIPAYATNTITNTGTLTIGEGVVIKNGSDGGASYAVDNHGKFVMNGGRLEAEKCALRVARYNQDDVQFTMNGGEIVAATPCWVQLPGSDSNVAPKIAVVINGGKMETTKESSEDNNIFYTYSYGNSHANTSITINGGEFLGGTVSIGSGYKGDAAKLTIKGGTFEYDVMQWLAGGESKVLYEANY